ncbi:DNA glycosylase [Nemania sp. FL0916]|nr:DNA glycosylase [Nemania sp. FL0916]
MRRSSRQAQKQASESSNAPKSEVPIPSHPAKSRKRTAPTPQTRSDASNDDDDDYHASDRELSNKKRRTTTHNKKGLKTENLQVFLRLFRLEESASTIPPCRMPQRIHNIDYHRPLLLQNPKGQDDLLQWFDSVSQQRMMPWRKAWIDPGEYGDNLALLRQDLERRAYEVWISEIMLQQTRVAVVIDYWNKWMEKWPTIHELAAADPDDVLAAWRGLGYYSRATRIHEAAKLVCGDPVMKGLLPAAVEELVAKVPGVGRYTAGAISAIVFGKAAPMVDGNVLRVLSRQLGLLGNVKSDKAVIDLLWAAADSLVKSVAEGYSETATSGAGEEPVSDRPGRWGQALMELGSTICTPKPDCDLCPITNSCRAYGEGLEITSAKGMAPKPTHTHPSTGSLPDIEDACNFCEPFEEVLKEGDDNEAQNIPVSKKNASQHGTKSRPRIQATISAFFTESSPTTPTEISRLRLATIIDHARRFPVKAIKKAIKEQETLVCAIRRSDGRYLIHRRPQKGLLAGLWEFPSWVVPEDHETSVTAYEQAAKLCASGALGLSFKPKTSMHPKLKFAGKLGSVPWQFSHLKLTMHVFLFELDCSNDEFDKLPDPNDRWSGSVEEESMGTGMRKCWDLVREVNGD